MDFVICSNSVCECKLAYKLSRLKAQASLVCPELISHPCMYPVDLERKGISGWAKLLLAVQIHHHSKTNLGCGRKV